MKVSLAAKGLILVSIPLCFELGFAALFTKLQNQAEDDARQAVKARLLSERVNELTRDIWGTWKAVGTAGDDTLVVKSGRVDTGLYKAAFAKLRVHYRVLMELTSDKPEMKLAVKESMALLDQGEAILDDAAKQIKEGNIQEVLSTYHEKSARLKTLFTGLLSQELMLIARHNADLANKNTEQSAERRSRIMRLALLTVCANAIFSVLLAIFLIRGITSRLATLNRNVERVEHGDQLLPRLEGSDEIAELDSAFHKMDESLKEAARKRQELVNMITHDLRTPLSVIAGSLEVFSSEARGGELSDSGQRMVKLIKRNSSRMMTMIGDLLDLEKMQAGMMKIDARPVKVIELFDDVKADVADLLEERKIEVRVVDTPLVVKGDQDQLFRVLLNLVSNAIKHSTAGGVITLAAESSAEGVELRVSDTGAGIPQDMLEHIFEPFHQVQSGGSGKEGSGLGLAICRAIVGMHEGRIWATSVPGEGSTFHVLLRKHV